MITRLSIAILAAVMATATPEEVADEQQGES